MKKRWKHCKINKSGSWNPCSKVTSVSPQHNPRLLVTEDQQIQVPTTVIERRVFFNAKLIMLFFFFPENGERTSMSAKRFRGMFSKRSTLGTRTIEQKQKPFRRYNFFFFFLHIIIFYNKYEYYYCYSYSLLSTVWNIWTRRPRRGRHVQTFASRICDLFGCVMWLDPFETRCFFRVDIYVDFIGDFQRVRITVIFFLLSFH